MTNNIKKYLNVKKISYIVLGSLFLAIGVNYFITPVELYTGGLMGIILILDKVTGGVVGFSMLYFLANLPLLVLSWLKLGKRFTFYTIIAVFAISLFTTILPEIEPISTDKLIMSLFGGVVSGLGVFFLLHAGGSAGGIDIISLYFSERTGKTLGFFALIINIIVLALTALLFNFEVALYTLIGAYVTSIVIDKFHTRYQKLTVTINTNNADELIAELQAKSPRGVTIVPAIGGYTKAPRQLLYIVISGFELTYILELVKKHDENAFVNVSKSIKVLGNFITPSIDET